MRFATFLDRFPAERLLRWSTLCAVACAASLAGAVAAFALRTELDPPVVLRGSGSAVAAVSIERFRDGALRGHAAGPVRLFLGGKAVDVAPDGAFAADVPALRVEEVGVAVPEGMAFVASRKGKKYYKVDSSSGERIAPQNRVYFRDEASAEAAGFLP